MSRFRILLYRQLELFAGASVVAGAPVGEAVSFPSPKVGKLAASPTGPGRDEQLEGQAREMLRALGLTALAQTVRVEWSPRLRTAAGRADYRHNLVTLNPLLRPHGAKEIDRTLRHELAHLVAHARRKRRRISPHGPEWRQACRDLGIADEQRCHSLPFPRQTRARPFLYRCPQCLKEFPRVRKIRRGVACLACCRRHSQGRFDKRFTLQLVASAQPSTLSRVER